MTRFVCLILVSVVACSLHLESVGACSEVRDMTLRESCPEFCKNVGDFMQEGMKGMDVDENLVRMIHEWIEDNGYLGRPWNCDDLGEIIQRAWIEMKMMQEEYSENNLEEMAKERKEDIQKIIESFVKTMVEKLSESCRAKIDDLHKQIFGNM